MTATERIRIMNKNETKYNKKMIRRIMNNCNTIYKKYYPLTLETLLEMKRKDILKISLWVKEVEKNYKSFIRKRRWEKYENINIYIESGKMKWEYKFPMGIAQKLKQEDFFRLDAVDIKAINFVIYCNRYNFLFAKYLFPVTYVASIKEYSLGKAQMLPINELRDHR